MQRVYWFAALIAAALSTAPAWADIPYHSTGNLGALSVTTPGAEVVFNTTEGVYTINGVLQNGSATVVAVAAHEGVNNAGTLHAFNFTSINIGSGVKVTAKGNSPLVLLASGSINWSGDLNLDGIAGGSGNDTSGGGGGGGGGAAAIFAESSVRIYGSLSAAGGDGGLRVEGGSPTGGQGGPGGPGGGAGGTGGYEVAGGSGANGGEGGGYTLGTTTTRYGGGGGGGR